MGRLRQRRPDTQETTATWVDADDQEHRIKVVGVVHLRGDGTVDLEVELPFGALGGVLITRITRTLVTEIAQHQERSAP